MSHAFEGSVFTFTQPNGEKFQVRGWGDQASARFETLDGYTVVQNPATGFYEIARPSSDGLGLEASGIRAGDARESAPAVPRGLRPRRRSAATEAQPSILTGKTRWQQRNDETRGAVRESMSASIPMPAPPQRQTVGTFIGLCLPVQFPDVPTTVSPQDIDDFCNQPGYTGFGNNGSVRDYFLANSLGRCDYSTLVAPLYTAKRPRSHYTDPSVSYGKRAQELIHEALAHHKSNGFDFSRLTVDSSRFVYAINVFYAGHVENNWSKGLWPHAHFLSSTVTLAPGKIAHDYQITAMGSALELGTYCHENGHMLCDFPDLYDYDSDSFGIGKFCLMCAGNHADQRNPVHVGAYLKFRAGWAGSVTPLTPGLTATAVADQNQFFLLRKNSSEYYLVENRHKSGRDSALPDEGLAVWHVDELGNNKHQQDHPSQHYECALIQADGLRDLEQKVNQGDVGDLYGPDLTFVGRWWDRKPLGIKIENIDPPGPAISFKVGNE